MRTDTTTMRTTFHGFQTAYFAQRTHKSMQYAPKLIFSHAAVDLLIKI
jgi:hypothetical protein